MGRGRPRKSSAQRHSEGNPGKRPVPPDMDLDGAPSPTMPLTDDGRSHFMRLAGPMAAAGSLKGVDSDGLTMIASLWEQYWAAAREGDVKAVAALSARWASLMAHHCITPAERAKLMAGVTNQAVDPVRAKFRIAQ